MSTSNRPSLAILDDYAGVANAQFKNISGLDVEVFSKTLNPKKSADLEQLVQRLEKFSVVSTMRERTPMPQTLLSQLPNLKLLLTTGVRNASIDLEYCKQRGIIVAGTTAVRPKGYDKDGHPIHDDESAPAPPPPGYDSTTQHAWSLLLSLTSRIPTDHSRLREDTSAWQSGLTVPLGGRTLGVVGLGKLGTSFCRIASAGFGMNVIAWSENMTQEKADAAAEKVGLAKGTFKAVSREELFTQADVVSVHYVLSDRSRGIVGERELGWMKKTAMLINSSRGPLIDEQALLKCLNEGRIRGVALDVFWEEPLPADSKWRTTAWGQDGRSMVVLSPHMGYVNEATMQTWYAEQAADVQRWLNGEEPKTRLA